MMGRGRTLASLASAVVVAACSDPTTVPEPDDVVPLPADAVIDEFGAWDSLRWEVMDHTLGRGRVSSANTVHRAGLVELHLPSGSTDGAEFRSVSRLGPGVVEGRIRANGEVGALTALFLYEGVTRRNNEIDVELIAGSHDALFTVWQDGREVFHTSVPLGFDPSAGFHDYRITWTSETVEWRVDGVLRARADELTLTRPLHLYVNAWWPTWLEGGPSATDGVAVVERLVF